MPRSLRWRDLAPGILTAVLLAVVTAFTLAFARVGTLRGDTFRLYTAVGEARGIMKGSQVWLYGRPIGLVDAIHFRPATSAIDQRLVLELRVLEEFRRNLRHDVNAQIRAGGTLIGQPVVYITGGTPKARLVAEGDTIVSRPQVDFEGMTSELGYATQNLPFIIDNVKLLGAQLEGARGTLGAIVGTEGGIELEPVRQRSARIIGRLKSGQGTVARAMDPKEGLMVRARVAMSRVDTVRTLLASPRTSFGRYRRDSTLVREVGELRDEIAIVRRMLEDQRGAAGRLLNDKALQRALTEALASMNALFDDLARHPTRYLQLF